MGKPGELSDLKKHLQKAFIALKDYKLEVSASNSNVTTTLKSITNLSEQLLSCTRVKDSDFPEGTAAIFRDAKERLNFKLTYLITEDVNELQQIIQKQKVYREKFSRLYDICVTKFDRLNNQENHLLLLTERSALSPSLSEMLEILHWSDCRLRESCLAKTYILEEFRPESYNDEKSLEKAWSSAEEITMEKIEDLLLLTSFFLEEKIT